MQTHCVTAKYKIMGRKKGSLNKKTLERLAMQGLEETGPLQEPLITGVSEVAASEEPVINENNESGLQENQVIKGKDINEEKNEEKEEGVENNKEEERRGVDDEQSLLDDFLKSQTQQIENQEEDSYSSNSFNFLPLEKQVKALDYLIVTILKFVLKKQIEYMKDDELEFICSLAGNDDVNLLPSSKYMFYVGLAGYYLTKML